MEQMTIFDILYPERINPVCEVAKMSRPYWTTSRQKLINLCNRDPDIKTFAAAVKHEYSPYGFAGHYGGNDKPNTMIGYTMRTNLIEMEYVDATGKKIRAVCSWEDFAREVADMIWSGEYHD